MFANSSSSNDSSLPPPKSSNHSPIPDFILCVVSRPGSYIFPMYSVTSILLLLPPCVFILHHGLQLWRQKRSASSGAAVSHTDCFTYHMVVVELFRIIGCVLWSCGIYSDNFDILAAGALFVYFTWYGESFFHVLTCVERYLAVVHPITYLSLRNQRGIRIRNISIACVWLLCCVLIIVVNTRTLPFLDILLLTLCLTVTSFCSLAVLCVLIRPGPGEQGGGRERVDQSKKRAFYTIMFILGALLLRFVGHMAWFIMHVLQSSSECVAMACAFWFNLPGSLVLPLLFLHRAGKCVCWKKNNQ